MTKHRNSMAAKVRRYVKSFPDASRAEIAKSLEIPRSYVSTILWNAKKRGLIKISKAAVEATVQAEVAPMQKWKLVHISASDNSIEKVMEKELPIGMTEVKADVVNHPAHYKVGGIETIDFIEAKGLNYNIGNVVKYVTRADHKGNRLQDLQKAKWYLEREIASIEEVRANVG